MAVSRGRFLGILLRFEATWVCAGAPPAPHVQTRSKQKLTEISHSWDEIGPKLGARHLLHEAVRSHVYHSASASSLLSCGAGSGEGHILLSALLAAQLTCRRCFAVVALAESSDKAKKSTCKHKPVHSQAPRMSQPSGTPRGTLKSCNAKSTHPAQDKAAPGSALLKHTLFSDSWSGTEKPAYIDMSCGNSSSFLL